MQRMRARRTSQHVVAAGTDKVLVGISLPSDTVVHRVTGTTMIEPDGAQNLKRALFCMMEGYVLPVLDPDAGSTMDTIWDNLVPKDTDVTTMDLDTAALDTTPFSEPGEADWSALLDLGLRPKKVYGDERMLTFANSPTGFHITSADVINFMPVATFNLGLDNGPFRVSQPSILCYALGSPNLDDTTATVEQAGTENQWGRHKYITELLNLAMHQLFGLTEAGAETPWVEAVDLLQQLLEPDVFEQTAGSFGSLAWTAFTRMIVEYSVAGTYDSMVITSGRGNM